MFNRKFILISLSALLVLISLLFIQEQVSAQWIAPPSGPGSGDVTRPLTNPLTVDLNFQDDSGRHSILNAQNANFAGTVRGTTLCIGTDCKSVWPSGDVSNPMKRTLDAGGYAIVNLMGLNTEKPGTYGALEALAGINKAEGNSEVITAGLYAQTQSDSRNAYSYAIYGVSNNTNGYGIFGAATSGKAGYFIGPVDIQGTLTLTAGQEICLGGTCHANWPEPSGPSLPAGTSGQTLRHNGTDWVANGLLYNNGANVGIGVTNPAEKLQVAGNLRLDDGGAITEGNVSSVNAVIGYNDLFLKGNSLETSDVNLGGSNISTWTNSLERLTVLNNGNVGISNNNPGQKLDVNGTIRAISYLYNSDQNLKKNIRTIQNPVDIIKQLRGVAFDWKDNNQPGIGFIGQEVEKVLPELVFTDSQGYKSVQYGNLTAVVIETLKAQQQQIEKLQAEIDQLKNK